MPYAERTPRKTEAEILKEFQIRNRWVTLSKDAWDQIFPNKLYDPNKRFWAPRCRQSDNGLVALLLRESPNGFIVSTLTQGCR